MSIPTKGQFSKSSYEPSQGFLLTSDLHSHSRKPHRNGCLNEGFDGGDHCISFKWVIAGDLSTYKIPVYKTKISFCVGSSVMERRSQQRIERSPNCNMGQKEQKLLVSNTKIFRLKISLFHLQINCT